MRREVKISIGGKSKEYVIKSRETYAPLTKVVKSKKAYSRKVKHKSQIAG